MAARRRRDAALDRHCDRRCLRPRSSDPTLRRLLRTALVVRRLTASSAAGFAGASVPPTEAPARPPALRADDPSCPTLSRLPPSFRTGDPASSGSRDGGRVGSRGFSLTCRHGPPGDTGRFRLCTGRPNQKRSRSTCHREHELRHSVRPMAPDSRSGVTSRTVHTTSLARRFRAFFACAPPGAGIDMRKMTADRLIAATSGPTWWRWIRRTAPAAHR